MQGLPHAHCATEYISALSLSFGNLLEHKIEKALHKNTEYASEDKACHISRNIMKASFERPNRGTWRKEKSSN